MTAENTAAPATADPSADPTATPADPTSAAPSPDAPAAPEPAATPAAPETYEFQMPEGVELDQAAVDRFTPLFKEAGLTQEAANKLVAAYAEHIGELGGKGADAFESAYTERRQAEISQQIEADAKALKADTEIGGANFTAVNKRVADFIGEHGTPEFRAFIDARGIGNNPEFVRVLNRAIDYRPIDTGEQPAGAGGGAPDDPRARWYPDLVKK
jgi:hypothetical protein